MSRLRNFLVLIEPLYAMTIVANDMEQAERIAKDITKNLREHGNADYRYARIIPVGEDIQ